MAAATLRWEYVNLDRLTLTIPDTKNRRPLYAPLCRQSLEILERRLAQREEGCPFVFPAVKTVRYSTNKTGHVRLMATALKLNTGLNITVHGLRRTFITDREAAEDLRGRRPASQSRGQYDFWTALRCDGC